MAGRCVWLRTAEAWTAGRRSCQSGQIAPVPPRAPPQIRQPHHARPPNLIGRPPAHISLHNHHSATGPFDLLHPPCLLRGPGWPPRPRPRRPSDRHLIRPAPARRPLEAGERDSLVQGTLLRRTPGRKCATDCTVPRQPCLRRPFSCGPAPTLLPPAHVGHAPSPETIFHSNPPRTPQGYQSRRCSRASLR